MGVVHLDIQAGYNATANIRYNDSKKMMALIDFESLIEIPAWLGIMSKYGQYIQEGEWAFRFVVFWQCICMAFFAWIMQKNIRF
jgi:putative effector of murein hydrolase LrgA (UPF0299 family)